MNVPSLAHLRRELEGESGSAAGYTLLGRLYAVGYMKGVLQAIGAS